MFVLSLITAFAADPITVIGGLSQELPARPGVSEQGELGVRNNTDRPMDVMVYQRDYTFQSDGNSRYDDPGTVKGSNAAWIQLGVEQLRLPPNEVVAVPWTMDVPADAAEGTHWSVVMIEPMGERFAPQTRGRAIGVNTVYRSAVQLVTHIGDGTPEVTFTGKQLENGGDGVHFAVDIANAGPTWFVPELTVELTDAEGQLITTRSAGRRRLFPGTSTRFWTSLGPLDPGTYEALVVADGGDDSVFGARVPVTIQ
jgi:hypothetical protein